MLINCAEKERLEGFISIQYYTEIRRYLRWLGDLLPKLSAKNRKNKTCSYLSVIQTHDLANPVGDTETDQHDPGAQIINTLEIPALVSL